MRKCMVCKETLALEEFNRNSGKHLGRRYYCKRCAAAMNLGRKREGTPEVIKKKNRRWRTANPIKYAAQRAVYRALRRGIIFKGPCEQCGSSANIHGHHDDYSRPLMVRWLCEKHHLDVHRVATRR